MSTVRDLRPQEARLVISGLTLGYAGQPVVHELDWSVEPGSLTAIVGANGSGKSTLLKGLAGELVPLRGRIDLDGIERRQIAYLPQSTPIDRLFPITVADFVGMGLWGKIGAFGGIGRHWARQIDDALAAVGLSAFRTEPIARLSGGQMQRVLFARLVLQDAAVILLDEPFAAVDQETTIDLVELIKAWHGEGRTVIVALHDLDQVRRNFPQTLKLTNGHAVLGATASILSVASQTTPAPASTDMPPAARPSSGAVA